MGTDDDSKAVDRIHYTRIPIQNIYFGVNVGVLFPIGGK